MCRVEYRIFVRVVGLRMIRFYRLRLYRRRDLKSWQRRANSHTFLWNQEPTFTVSLTSASNTFSSPSISTQTEKRPSIHVYLIHSVPTHASCQVCTVISECQGQSHHQRSLHAVNATPHHPPHQANTSLLLTSPLAHSIPAQIASSLSLTSTFSLIFCFTGQISLPSRLSLSQCCVTTFLTVS
jgi:hypothetical protein